MTDRPSADDLRALRKRLRLTQDELAKMLGISRIRWSRYEYGHSRIPTDLVSKLAAVESQMSYLGGSDGGPSSTLFGAMATIPVAGKVAAGEGTTNVDPDNEPILVPHSLANMGVVGFVIDGESMMPVLQPGDIAVFKQSHTPRKGFTHLVKTQENEFRCKVIEWKQNRWTLVSLNEAFPDEHLGEAQVLGLLVGRYRSVGSYEMLEADPNGLRLEAS